MTYIKLGSKFLKSATLSLLAVSVFATTFTACGTKSKEETLVFGKAKDAVKLDPADISEGESSAVTQNMFETLVKYKDESTEVEPALAESWKVSDDGLTWTFKLKKGIKFHDGTEFNAEAVKFNYDRQMDKKSPFRFDGKFEYWDMFFTNVLKIEVKGNDNNKSEDKNVTKNDKVTVLHKKNENTEIKTKNNKVVVINGDANLDENEIRFTLKDKDPTFLPNLALFTMGIASPKAIKVFGKDFFKNPVGTGPFKFVSWTQNEKIILKANDSYWGEKAKLKKLIFKPIPDNSVRLLELEKGSIQGMDGINPDDLAKMQSNKDLSVITQLGMNVAYLAMNTEKPPFDNPKVRLAVNYAINRDALIKAFFADGKVGIPAKNPIPPTLWSYNDKIEAFKADKEKAKKLIKESGANLDKTIDFWAMPIARPYMPNPSKIAESIQADLQDIGLKTKIVTYEWGTYLEKAGKGEHDMCLLGWIGDNGDPDNFLYALLSSKNTKKGSASNYAFYKSAEMDKYLDDAKKELDHKKRTDMYMKAQEVFHKDVPWAPLFHSTQLIAFRSNYKGYKLHPTGAKIFKNVFVDKGN